MRHLQELLILIGAGFSAYVAFRLAVNRAPKPTDAEYKYWHVSFRAGCIEDDLTIMTAPGIDQVDMANEAIKLYTDGMQMKSGTIIRINQISLQEYKMIRARLLGKLNFSHDLI